MSDYNHSSHTVHDIKYHFVWLTKYRYKVLGGKISQRLRELLIQGASARGITTIEGNIVILVASKTLFPPFTKYGIITI